MRGYFTLHGEYVWFIFGTNKNVPISYIIPNMIIDINDITANFSNKLINELLEKGFQFNKVK